ncbi:beta strand repeat-containing protein [Polaromonas sp. YR568]|uniref:beta strand repeat-containing protein n=1 Tax=Polaromonas sp. YR568 TaxID=1855301 RepID=UPI00398BF37B
MKSHASMNRIYRLVWNAALNLWVAVAENAKGQGKSGSARNKAALLMLLPLAALMPDARAADAANATVTAGAAGVSTAGNTTTINQASQRAAIDWTSLSTRANEALIFNQPNAQAIALNRITGSSPSELLGSLTANGQVFILNPNGVLFGAGSQVNVGGLVASTLSMSNADFMDGKHVFTGSGGSGSVVNQGTLNAASGGYLALLAPEVRNEGVMTASLGTALLAAGNKVTLNLDNGSLLGYSIDQGAINALAENKQLIQANGGQVLLSAKAMNSLATATVNNAGVIEAKTLQNKAGRIMLMGDMETGTVNMGGTLDASAPDGGDGGFVETSAAHVNITAGTRVTTLSANGNSGTWLIDPVDFTIAATGGDISGATLSSNLASNSVVTIQSSSGATGTLGDVNVNDAVTWSANKLTLNAQNNININANLNASGTAQLALEYGQGSAAGSGSSYSINNGAKVNLPAGNNFSTKQGSSGTMLAWTVINSLGSAGSTTATDLQGINGGLNGRYVLGADIDATITSGWNTSAGFAPIGGSSTMFSGSLDGLGHTVSNLTIKRSSAGYVGLFGYTGNGSVIRNVGLVGGSVTGGSYVGGLVGYNTGSISNAYATGSVTGGLDVGGLVGINLNGSISNAYASGSVTGGDEVGGLVGSHTGTINNVYASGSVTGSYSFVGGLVGVNQGTIGNAYASGSVTGGGSLVGGLVGFNAGTIGNAYASGIVTGSSVVGGLAGLNVGTVTNSYWDITTTGQASSAGGTGFTNANAFAQSSYSGFDFGATWWMSNANTRPFLRSEYSTTINNAHQLQLAAMNLGASYTLGSNIDMAELSRASGMWNTATGFAPIGDNSTMFSGSFDGLGHTVSNLTINRSSTGYVGLFGYTGNGSVIRNVGLTGGSVTGGNDVGGLVGYNTGSISNAYATSSVVGSNYVGGLVGENDSNGSINNAYASGSVTGNSYVGGLVGQSDGSISNAYATSSVVGSNDVGGLVGVNFRGTITASFWLNSISTTGIGSQGGTIDSFSRGLSASEATSAGTYSAAGWGVATAGGSSSVWRIYDGRTMPLLRSFLTALTVTTGDVSKTYDGTTSLSDSYTLSDSRADTSRILGIAAYSTSSKNVGSYAVSTSGLYSGQQGYDISYVNGAATITAATLTVSGTTAANKTYDGTAAATLSGNLGGFVSGDAVALSQSGSFSDKNAATGKRVSYTNSLSGADAGNYVLASASGTTTATISQAALTISGITAGDKTYDAGTSATVNTAGASYNGLFAGDVVNVAATGQFSDKNAGANKTVNLSSSYSGADAGNYAISSQASTTATIHKADLTVQATGTSKVYDGTTVANVAFSNNALAGDVLNVSSSASFADSNAGLNKAVSVTGIAVGGSDAGNYNLISGTTASTTADITPKQLTVTANNDTQMSGAPYSGGNGVSYNGLVTGDTATAVLAGNLAYGGSAQGAYLAGDYDITPGGLLANGNYSLRFVQGRLTLSGGDAASVALGGTALVGAYQTSLNTLSGDSFVPRVMLGDSKGKGDGDDAAAASVNAAAAEATDQSGGN